LTVILRLLSFKAEALLATHATTAKSELIPRFNARLSKHCAVGSAGYADSANDIEVMVLSYYMNSGLNLQYQCPFLHACSPPISESVWQQTCGRIVRFGQPSECLVLEYFVTGTFNQKQIATATSNAFVSHAALTLGGIAPLTRSENENDMGYQSKMADLLCWVRFEGKMYDNRDPSTPEFIRKMAPLSLDDVILHKLQSKGPMDVKAKISGETSDGNQNIESVEIAKKAMFANYAELSNTSAKPKKAASTPTKARVSASPANHKANLDSIKNLKTAKARKRKATSSSQAETPTKQKKAKHTASEELGIIGEEDSNEEIPYSSPLTGHDKNSHEATREQIEDAIGEAIRPNRNPLGDFSPLPVNPLGPRSESGLSGLEDNMSTAGPKQKQSLILKLKNNRRVKQPELDINKQQLTNGKSSPTPKGRKRALDEDSTAKTNKKPKTRAKPTAQAQPKAPSRASTRQTKKPLSKDVVTDSDLDDLD